MLISVFKSNQRLVNVLTVIVAVCLWIPIFWANNYIVNNKYTLFYNLSVLNNYKFLSFLFSVLLISSQAIYLNHLVNQFKLIKNNTHLVALFYVLICASNTSLLVVNPIIIANTFLLIATHQLFNMYNVKKAFALAFNSGLLVAVAMLFYFPAILFFPLIWAVLIYTRTPKWREFVISILGFILPVVFYLAYYFVTSHLSVLLNDRLINHTIFLNEQIPITEIGRSFFYSIIIVGLFACVNIVQHIDKNVVKIRKLILIIMLMMLMLCFSLFINSFDYLATYLLMSIPFSIVLANYFNEIKRTWLAEIIFLCLIITLIISYFS